MAVTLDMRAAEFEPRFRALLAAKREASVDVDAAVAAIIADVRARGDAALIDYTLRFDRVDLSRSGFRIAPAEIEAAVAACDRKALEALELAHERVLAYHRRQLPGDVSFVDHLGVQLGWRWRRDRRGRPLRARRRGELSVLGDHERRAGERRRLPPHRHGRADARRQAQSAGARRGARSPGVERNLPRRRRAGDRRARLRHREHRAGRQDRRPRQRLCRGGQAAGVRRRRHRHDRRPVGGRRARRRQRRRRATSRPTCSPRPSTTRRRSRSSSPTTRGWRATSRAEVEAQLADLPRAEIAGASWRDYGAIILVADLAAAPALIDRLAPEHLEIIARDAEALSAAIAQRRRDLPRAAYARGDRRLCRRLQSRAADFAFGALLLRARRLRLRQAHLDPQMRRAIAGGARPGGGDARRGRGPHRARALGGACAWGGTARRERRGPARRATGWRK